MSRYPQVPPPPGPPRPSLTWQAIRDVLLFIAGLALAGYEVVLAPTLRVEVLVLAAAMLGLPAVFRLPQDRP